MQRDLVISASSGDHDAFASLATTAYSRLYRIAQLIVRHEEIASDAVQEALTSAWIHIRAVRDPDKFDAWLNRLVIHASYRELRRARRGPVQLNVEVIELAQVGDLASSVADRDQLERGFRRLSPEHRAVLVVHHYLRLPDGEAAIVLDVPIGTYKSRLNRAHVAMRAALDADGRVAAIAKEAIA